MPSPQIKKWQDQAIKGLPGPEEYIQEQPTRNHITITIGEPLTLDRECNLGPVESLVNNTIQVNPRPRYLSQKTHFSRMTRTTPTTASRISLSSILAIAEKIKIPDKLVNVYTPGTSWQPKTKQIIEYINFLAGDRLPTIPMERTITEDSPVSEIQNHNAIVQSNGIITDKELRKEAHLVITTGFREFLGFRVSVQDSILNQYLDIISETPLQMVRELMPRPLHPLRYPITTTTAWQQYGSTLTQSQVESIDSNPNNIMVRGSRGLSLQVKNKVDPNGKYYWMPQHRHTGRIPLIREFIKNKIYHERKCKSCERKFINDSHTLQQIHDRLGRIAGVCQDYDTSAIHRDHIQTVNQELNRSARLTNIHCPPGREFVQFNVAIPTSSIPMMVMKEIFCPECMPVYESVIGGAPENLLPYSTRCAMDSRVGYRNLINNMVARPDEEFPASTGHWMQGITVDIIPISPTAARTRMVLINPNTALRILNIKRAIVLGCMLHKFRFDAGSAPINFLTPEDQTRNRPNIFETAIAPYSWKPPMYFWPTGEHRKEIHYSGLELEICTQGASINHETIMKEIHRATGRKHLFFKSDSSTGGFEIVTEPHTLEEHFKVWAPGGPLALTMNYLRLHGVTSQHATSHGYSCGLHVHSTLAAWSPMAIHRLLKFLYDPDNIEFVKKFSRRTNRQLSQWAQVRMTTPSAQLSKSVKAGTHYRHPRGLIHFTKKTMEFRAPRGTMIPATIIGTLATIDALRETAHSFKEVNLDNLKKITMSRQEYRPARLYLQARGIIQYPVKDKKGDSVPNEKSWMPYNCKEEENQPIEEQPVIIVTRQRNPILGQLIFDGQARNWLDPFDHMRYTPEQVDTRPHEVLERMVAARENREVINYTSTYESIRDATRTQFRQAPRPAREIYTVEPEVNLSRLEEDGQ